MTAKKSTGIKTTKKETTNNKKSWIRDILVIVGVVAVVGILLFAVSGTWPALVAIESGSMEPNIMTYALAFVVDENRYGGWQTHKEAAASGSRMMFNEYGDVIVYKPNGTEGVTPIIHRAISRVTAEKAVELGFTGTAAHAGIITKGDNNHFHDQYPDAYFDKYGRMQPVKEEWIIGKALFVVPLIGWIPLNIFRCILIAGAIFAAIEIISRIRGKK